MMIDGPLRRAAAPSYSSSLLMTTVDLFKIAEGQDYQR